MLPDLAAHAINHYTQPGDILVDPLAGIGTTVIEAIHAGRNAVGIEIEPGWCALATASIALAEEAGAAGHGRMVRGDATDIPSALPVELTGQVALVLTSPPRHAILSANTPTDRTDTAFQDRSGAKIGNHGGSESCGNRVRPRRRPLRDGLTTVLGGCVRLLQPGGTVIVTVPPRRHGRPAVDLPSVIREIGENAGLRLVDQCVALLAPIDESQIQPRRPPRSRLGTQACAHEAGHYPVHEMVFVFRTLHATAAEQPGLGSSTAVKQPPGRRR